MSLHCDCLLFKFFCCIYIRSTLLRSCRAPLSSRSGIWTDALCPAILTHLKRRVNECSADQWTDECTDEWMRERIPNGPLRLTFQYFCSSVLYFFFFVTTSDSTFLVPLLVHDLPSWMLFFLLFLQRLIRTWVLNHSLPRGSPPCCWLAVTTISVQSHTAGLSARCTVSHRVEQQRPCLIFQPVVLIWSCEMYKIGLFFCFLFFFLLTPVMTLQPHHLTLSHLLKFKGPFLSTYLQGSQFSSLLLRVQR